jgi:hypothetical protein
MKTLLITAALIVGLGACAHAPPPGASLAALHESTDWASVDGAKLSATLESTLASAATGGRAALLADLAAAGYECQYGEASADYPEPAAVCKRSFATRACQFDWEVGLTSLPSKPGKVETSDATFTRDCVGLGQDWPVPVKSAIDDQLAPPPADLAPPADPS